MKTTIENLEFPCEIKKKLKMKVSMGNLEVEFINGHLIKFDKTNLSVQEPYKIIVSNKKKNTMGYGIFHSLLFLCFITIKKL